MTLAHQSKVPEAYRSQFVAKVISISQKLEINPNWLMGIMYWESAYTFSPSKKNNIGCVGLIQFCPDSPGGSFKTINGKKYYLSDLAKMTAIQQLDVVYQYYLPYKGKIKGYIDCYFVTFFPAAIGKPDDWILQASGISPYSIWKSNPGFRVDKEQNIKVWEVKKIMLQKLPSEWINEGSPSLVLKAYKMPITIVLGSIIIGTLGYIGYGKFIKQ